MNSGLRQLNAPEGIQDAVARALGMGKSGEFDYITYDPLPALERVSQPALAIYGTQDMAVPVVQSSRELAAA